MNRNSLKFRFALAVAVAYSVVGLFTFLSFHYLTEKLVDSLGARFAAKQALLEKSRLMSAIRRDLSLSLKMADSPLLVRWVLDENNKELKEAAAEELESYRQSLEGKSIFIALNQSGHYYFTDGSEARALEKPRYTLDPDNINDSWYYRSMRDVDDFELNVDYDNHLDMNKIWFNVVIKDDAGNKLGLAGGGMDISSFIEQIVHSEEPGVETILFGRQGTVEAHRDSKYVMHNSKVRGDVKKITVYDLMNGVPDASRLKDAVHSLDSGNRDVITLHLTLEDRRRLAALSHLEEIGWYNLVLVDAGRFVSIRSFLPILAVTIGSMFALIVVVGFLLNRRVLAPLAVLASSTNRMAVGDYDTRVPHSSNDEIGALARCFNDMAGMVKDHSENLEQKVSERTEALNRANHQLEESNRRITASIRYARMIQTSVLPEKSAIERRTERFFVIYRPRDIVGGDFYFFRECGEQFVIAVIDCTGHGVPGAFMSMTANTVLDHVLDAAGCLDPAEILGELNLGMKAALKHDSLDSAIDNGLEIGLCLCDPPAGKVVFSGARIELHCIEGGALTTISGDKQAIGYRSSNPEFAYTNHSVSVAEKMDFYMASDGILDQSGGPKGWGFGRKRFKRLLADVSGLSAAEQKQRIEQAISLHQGDYPQRDDITIIGFSL